MPTYHLYLESGPMRRKTMVHIPQLLGCIAVGPTTEAALAATPPAIERFRAFVGRHGEPIDDGPVSIEVAEHVTTGQWLGNGSPYLLFATDLEPVDDQEMELLLDRFRAFRTTLASWAEEQGTEALSAVPAGGGRAPGAILTHLVGPEGAYLAAALGGAPGFSRLHTAVERAEIGPATALLQAADLADRRVREATPAQRAAVVERPRDVRTLRKALRRMLEHDWEHLLELSRRPGGPQV